MIDEFTVHMLNETGWHAGHADILREQLDGRTGADAGFDQPINVAAREANYAKIERAAKAAVRIQG
ncbi:MAG TPA: DUF664 domain-containing protein [Streptosporangiaceae bacterium]